MPGGVQEGEDAPGNLESVKGSPEVFGGCRIRVFVFEKAGAGGGGPQKHGIPRFIFMPEPIPFTESTFGSSCCDTIEPTRTEGVGLERGDHLKAHFPKGVVPLHSPVQTAEDSHQAVGVGPVHPEFGGPEGRGFGPRLQGIVLRRIEGGLGHA